MTKGKQVASAVVIVMQSQAFLRSFSLLAAERRRLRTAIDASPTQEGLDAFAQLGTPLIVCAAFAAELGLKALLRLVNVRFPARAREGHSLVVLTGLLPQDLSERITIALGCTEASLREYLAIVDQNFADWRYSFEHEYLVSHPEFLEALAHACFDQFNVVTPYETVPRIGNGVGGP